jgi:adenine phosphoribosyltransferase
MSYDGRMYTVQIGPLERHLPIFEVAPGSKSQFSTCWETPQWWKQRQQRSLLPATDHRRLVVPEVKAVPLAHALSAHSGLPYVVVRKVRKPYMVNCLESTVLSITTGRPQTLFVDGKDLQLVRGSTGRRRSTMSSAPAARCAACVS